MIDFVADGARIKFVAVFPDGAAISVAADAMALWVAAVGPVGMANGVAADGATIAFVTLGPDGADILVAADTTALWVTAVGPVGTAIGVAAGGATIKVIAVGQVGATNSAAAGGTTYKFTIDGWSGNKDQPVAVGLASVVVLECERDNTEGKTLVVFLTNSSVVGAMYVTNF